MFNLILDFKQWIVDHFLLNEVVMSKDHASLFKALKDFIEIENPIIGTYQGNKPIKNFFDEVYNNLKEYLGTNTKENFINSYLTTVLSRGFKSKDFHSNMFIRDDILKLPADAPKDTPKGAKGTKKADSKWTVADKLNTQKEAFPIVLNSIAHLLDDINNKKELFGKVLSDNKDNLFKTFNDFLINPRGKIGLDPKGKPTPTLFKSIYAPPKRKEVSLVSTPEQEDADDGKGGLGFQPTEKEQLAKGNYKLDLPKIEFDDVLRLGQKEFQKHLFDVTPDQAKQELNKKLKNHLDENKGDILTVDNLKFVQSAAKNKPEVYNTLNYLKIKSLHDIGEKFEKNIADLEGHTTDISATGLRYATLPKREFLTGPDSYFKNLSHQNLVDEIKRYIIAHGRSNKHPNIAIEFFKSLYSGDNWQSIVAEATSKAMQEDPSLFQRTDYPITEPESEDESEEEKTKKDRDRFINRWMNLSGQMKKDAESDINKYLPEDLSETEREEVKKLLNDFYYKKTYSTGQEDVRGFQKLILLYRVLLGLSAIEIAREDISTKKIMDLSSSDFDEAGVSPLDKMGLLKNFKNILKLKTSDDPQERKIFQQLFDKSKEAFVSGMNTPICKQLQMWLEHAFENPITGRASREEVIKIKEIKKIKDLLDSNQRLISNIFDKDLSQICNNEAFGTGEERFALTELPTWQSQQGVSRENYLATLKIKDLPKEEIEKIAQGISLDTIEDVLALRDSPKPDEQKMFKELLKKSKQFFKISPASISSAREKAKEQEFIDKAKEVLRYRGKNENDMDLVKKIADQIKKGPIKGSSLWQDLQLSKSTFTPASSVSREKEQMGIVHTPGSEMPSLPAWQRKESEAPTTTPSPIYEPLFSLKPKRGLV